MAAGVRVYRSGGVVALDGSLYRGRFQQHGRQRAAEGRHRTAAASAARVRGDRAEGCCRSAEIRDAYRRSGADFKMLGIRMDACYGTGDEYQIGKRAAPFA